MSNFNSSEPAVALNCPNCGKPLLKSKFGGEGAMWCKDYKKCGFKGIKGQGFKQTISTDPIPVLTTMSEEQKAVVKFTEENDENLIVEALAGTGKTTVLVQQTRVLHKIGHSVAIHAFARRDRYAIQARVNDKATVNTSSGWGLKMLSNYAKKCGYRANVNFDGMVGFQLIGQLKDDGLIPKEKDGGAWQIKRPVFNAITALVEKTRSVLPMSAKGTGGLPVKPSDKDYMDIALRFGIDINDADKEQVLHYTKILMSRFMSLEWCMKNGIDGTGMLFLPVYHDLRPAEADKFDRILVDECQDQSYYTRMVAQMWKKSNGRIIAVGDKNQAIYAWRGADSRSIEEMAAVMVGGTPKRLPLTECRRCSKEVIKVAQCLVPEIKSLPNAPEGKVEHMPTDDLLLERLVVERKGLVICRANAPLISLCLQLLGKKVGAIILRSNIVKDLLTLIENGSNGQGPDASIEKVLNHVNEWEQERLLKLSTRQGVERQIQTVQDKAACLRALADIPGVRTARDLKAQIDSMFEGTNDDERYKPDPKKTVVLSTVHGAKGGEAPTVYLYSPASKKEESASLWDAIWTDAEDRNNTLYVGITRAEHTLVFVGMMPRLERFPDSPTAQVEMIMSPLPVQSEVIKSNPSVATVKPIQPAIEAKPAGKRAPIVPQLPAPLPATAYVPQTMEQRQERMKKSVEEVVAAKKPVVKKVVKKVIAPIVLKKLPPLKIVKAKKK